jgi:hypothetical protein
MKIQDLIKDWRSLTWSGTRDGMDTRDLPNPATTIIEDVQEWRGNKDNRILGIVVTAIKDNRPVSDTLTVKLHLHAQHDLHLSPEQPIFDRLVTALKSAIGKTLNDAGNITV